MRSTYAAPPLTQHQPPCLPSLHLLAGTSHPELAQEVSKILGIPLLQADVKRFADQEIFVTLNETVRGGDVFVIQSTCCPGNDNIMELLIMLDTLKRAAAGRVIVCLPYYGYARQDRKIGFRVPISAKLVADLLTVAGADHVLTVDLHCGQIEGFFNCPVDHLSATSLFAADIQKNISCPTERRVIVSPDAGGVVRARALAKQLKANLAIIDKRRSAPGKSEALHVIGEVAGCTAIIVDDLVDSATTLCQAAQALKNAKAKAVYAYGTHGVLSGSALSRIENSCLESLTITNTIPLQQKSPKIRVLSVAQPLSETIERIHRAKSSRND